MVKLYNGWGGHVGQELSLSLHYSFLFSQSSCTVPSSSPCWEPTREAAPKSVLVSHYLVIGANPPRAARAGFPIPASPGLSPTLHFLFMTFVGMKRGIDCSHVTALTQGHHEMAGAKWLLQPLWCLGGMPTSLRTQGVENTRFQSDMNCDCNEDNGLCFKELEFINTWTVFCCQTQLVLLHIILWFDLTHKLLLSIPQWSAGL